MPPVERAGRRRLRAWWLVALALALSQADAGESDPAPAAPWQTNRPIVRVKKELYKPHPRPRAAMLVSVQYVGPRLERRE